MNLYEATKAVHHGAESTPLGQRMSSGTLSMQEWADWLGLMHAIHRHIDAIVPKCLQRAEQFEIDINDTRHAPEQLIATLGIVRALEKGDLHLKQGFAYVCCGANLRGGQVVRNALEPKGFPCAHLQFDSFLDANVYMRDLKERSYLAPFAQRAFSSIVGAMGEIDALRLCREEQQ